MNEFHDVGIHDSKGVCNVVYKMQIANKVSPFFLEVAWILHRDLLSFYFT
jgi:hypothetical protein